MSSAVRDQVRAQVDVPVWNQISYQVHVPVWNKVCGQVYRQLEVQVQVDDYLRSQI